MMLEDRGGSSAQPEGPMTGEVQTGPRRVVGELDGAAAELREVLTVARALGAISDEAELLDLINTTARDKLGYSVCVIAIKGDDGAFRYAATSGLSVEEDRALRSCVLSAPAFEALRDAAVTIGAVCWVAPGHPVRERPDVLAGTVATGVSVAPRSWQPGSLLFAHLSAQMASRWDC